MMSGDTLFLTFAHVPISAWAGIGAKFRPLQTFGPWSLRRPGISTEPRTSITHRHLPGLRQNTSPKSCCESRSRTERIGWVSFLPYRLPCDHVTLLLY